LIFIIHHILYPVASFVFAGKQNLNDGTRRGTKLGREVAIQDLTGRLIA